MTEQDLRDAFDRMVAAGPAPAGGTADVLAAARRARRRRSLLTVAVAAVAAVAVLVAGSALLGPSSAAPTAVHPTPTSSAAPAVPGISPSQAKRIVELCAAGYDGGESAPGLQLYNSIRSPWGIRYLLYGPNTYISCTHADRDTWNIEGSHGQTRWLPGPLSVDLSRADGLVPYDKGPGVYTTEGRVGSSVAAVRVRYGSAEVTVPAINGTFEVSLSVPGPEIVTGRSSIQAYDASGHPLPGAINEANRTEQYRKCWVTPDGTVFPTFEPRPPGQKCEPAVRWR